MATKDAKETKGTGSSKSEQPKDPHISEKAVAAARQAQKEAAAKAGTGPVSAVGEGPVDAAPGGVGEGGRSGSGGPNPVPVLPPAESQQNVMMEPGAEVVLARVLPADAPMVGSGPGTTVTLSEPTEGMSAEDVSKKAHGVFVREPGGGVMVSYSDSLEGANKERDRLDAAQTGLRQDYYVEELKLGEAR